MNNPLIISTICEHSSRLSELNPEHEKLQNGYIGSSIRELEEHLIKNKTQTHILFVQTKPDFILNINFILWRKKFHIDFIFVGPILPKELISVIISNSISGFLTEEDLLLPQLNLWIHEIKKNGYITNKHVPEEYWINRPSFTYPRVIPELTDREFQVLVFVCHAMPPTLIAQKCNTSEANVRKVIIQLRQKIPSHSTAELIVICIANLWVEIDTNIYNYKSEI
ncbi:MAG: DNA-binding CsgD family transcriptional regulator [Salibacteraceae bacterium]|jgi:DNA-binding CsgD family transcriptional regulator